MDEQVEGERCQACRTAGRFLEGRPTEPVTFGTRSRDKTAPRFDHLDLTEFCGKCGRELCRHNDRLCEQEASSRER